MKLNSFINAMYFMSSYGFCNSIPNRWKRMNFVKMKLKEIKVQKENNYDTGRKSTSL